MVRHDGRPHKGILESLQVLCAKSKEVRRKQSYNDHEGFRRSEDMRDWVNTCFEVVGGR